MPGTVLSIGLYRNQQDYKALILIALPFRNKINIEQEVNDKLVECCGGKVGGKTHHRPPSWRTRLERPVMIISNLFSLQMQRGKVRE